MPGTPLTRVKDLEKSSQWTSLASDINNLENLCRASERQIVARRSYDERSTTRRAISALTESYIRMDTTQKNSNNVVKTDASNDRRVEQQSFNGGSVARRTICSFPDSYACTDAAINAHTVSNVDPLNNQWIVDHNSNKRSARHCYDGPNSNRVVHTFGESKVSSVHSRSKERSIDLRDRAGRSTTRKTSNFPEANDVVSLMEKSSYNTLNVDPRIEQWTIERRDYKERSTAEKILAVPLEFKNKTQKNSVPNSRGQRSIVRQENADERSRRRTSIVDKKSKHVSYIDSSIGDKTDLPSEPIDSHRWSWKPRTEFEKNYFLDEYNRDYLPVASTNPNLAPCPPTSPQNQVLQDQRNPHPRRNPTEETVESYCSFDRLPKRLEFDRNYETRFSGSREKLHEIFEHNRYLRRKFFADMPSVQQESVCSDRKKDGGEIERCGGPGFGSTETLTSQSNQSSISSVNDRKPRGRSNETPELLEEDGCFVDFSRGNVDASRRRRRRRGEESSFADDGGRVSREGGKVLVNILPGNEVYVARAVGAEGESRNLGIRREDNLEERRKVQECRSSFVHPRPAGDVESSVGPSKCPAKNSRKSCHDIGRETVVDPPSEGGVYPAKPMKYEGDSRNFEEGREGEEYPKTLRDANPGASGYPFRTSNSSPIDPRTPENSSSRNEVFLEHSMTRESYLENIEEERDKSLKPQKDSQGSRNIIFDPRGRSQIESNPRASKHLSQIPSKSCHDINQTRATTDACQYRLSDYNLEGPRLLKCFESRTSNVPSRPTRLDRSPANEAPPPSSSRSRPFHARRDLHKSLPNLSTRDHRPPPRPFFDFDGNLSCGFWTDYQIKESPRPARSELLLLQEDPWEKLDDVFRKSEEEGEDLFAERSSKGAAGDNERDPLPESCLNRKVEGGEGVSSVRVSSSKRIAGDKKPDEPPESRLNRVAEIKDNDSPLGSIAKGTARDKRPCRVSQGSTRTKDAKVVDSPPESNSNESTPMEKDVSFRESASRRSAERREVNLPQESRLNDSMENKSTSRARESRFKDTVNGEDKDLPCSTSSKLIVEERDTREHFASHVQLSPSPSTVPREPSRRSKFGKIPPPLDLSKVNQEYDVFRAEKNHLNDYTVDVTILRDYDCPIEGLLTIVREDSKDLQYPNHPPIVESKDLENPTVSDSMGTPATIPDPRRSCSRPSW
ncbi:hypothetical protein KM043_014663 [Ampulex compressa]|nr:hypothetical protein KM043_014663 [Ampulex compressa]